MASQPSRRIFHALNGLRGLMALTVTIYHLGPHITQLLPALAPVQSLLASIAFRMDIFFILSGFILSYIYIGKQERFTWKAQFEFLWARFVRIYPGHLVMFLLLFAAVMLAKRFNVTVDGKYSVGAILPQLALIHTWFSFNWARSDWNYTSWFLSALWFAYVFLFPCVWMLAPRLRRSRWLLVLLFAPLLLRLPLNLDSLALQIYSVPRACCDIFSGCVLYFLYSRKSRLFALAQQHVDKLLFVGLLALSAALALSTQRAWFVVNSLLLLCSPILIAGVTTETSTTARFLTTRLMLWLGSLSYALFISHGVAHKALKILLPPDRYSGSSLAIRCLIAAAYMLAVLGFAVIVKRTVELRCVNWLHQIGGRPRNPKPAVSNSVPKSESN